MSRTAVLIEYFTADDRTLMFVVRADMEAPHVHTVPVSEDQLRGYVAERFGPAELRDVRRLAADEWQPPLRPLIAPIAEWSQPGDLVWLVPHDVLHYLPLHAVDVDGQPLIERNPVCYTPTASVMLYCRERRTGRHREALVIGDSRSDLPHAREEAQVVAGLFGGAPPVGEDASRSALLRELGDQPAGVDVLHLDE